MGEEGQKSGKKVPGNIWTAPYDLKQKEKSLAAHYEELGGPSVEKHCTRKLYHIVFSYYCVLSFLPILPVIIGKSSIFYRFTGKFKCR